MSKAVVAVDYRQSSSRLAIALLEMQSRAQFQYSDADESLHSDSSPASSPAGSGSLSESLIHQPTQIYLPLPDKDGWNVYTNQV